MIHNCVEVGGYGKANNESWQADEEKSFDDCLEAARCGIRLKLRSGFVLSYALSHAPSHASSGVLLGYILHYYSFSIVVVDLSR